MAQAIARTYIPTEDNYRMIWPALALTGEIDIDYLRRAIQTENMQMWSVWENGFVIASAVTEVIVYPKLQALRVIAIAGKRMLEWQGRMLELLTAFAKMHKCSRIEAVCRPGLEKFLKPLGFDKRLVCLLKELDYGEVRRYN